MTRAHVIGPPPQEEVAPGSGSVRIRSGVNSGRRGLKPPAFAALNPLTRFAGAPPVGGHLPS